MAHEHDFWMWETPQLNLNQIKQMNKIINERSIGVEETKYSARSGDGRLLKNIKPLRISMKHLMDTPIDDLIHTAEKAINTEYGYHIYPINKWDQLLHNRYSSDIQGYYGAHADGSRSDIYDIKMTLLINLSEGDYGGGDLIINGKTAPFREPGTMLFFKSHLLHEVTPVTSGERITLTHFFTGPRYR
tara:strand:- start:209 stop:772 length:564 start_codon:yes stop_codon:yes gene_type:complete